MTKINRLSNKPQQYNKKIRNKKNHIKITFKNIKNKDNEYSLDKKDISFLFKKYKNLY